MRNWKSGMIVLSAAALCLAVFGMVNPALADDAREEPMMRFVPTSSDFILSIDFAQVMELPFFEEMMATVEDDEDADFEKLMAILEKHNIDRKDALKKIVVFVDTEGEPMPGFLAQTGIGEAALKEILRAEADELEIDLDTQRIGNREVLLITERDDFMVPEGMEDLGDEKTGLVYLDGEHVLISPIMMLEGVLGQLDAGGTLARDPMERMGKVRRDSLLWAVYTGGFEFVPAEMRDETPLGNLAGLALSLGFIEQGEPDMQLKIDLEAGSAEGAQEVFGGLMQMQMFLQMMLGEEHPQLANKIAQALSLEQPEPLEVLLTFTMDEELQGMLKEMIEAQMQAEQEMHF